MAAMICPRLSSRETSPVDADVHRPIRRDGDGEGGAPAGLAVAGLGRDPAVRDRVALVQRAGENAQLGGLAPLAGGVRARGALGSPGACALALARHRRPRSTS